MTMLVVMIPLAVLLLLGAVGAFFWAVDHGQFDDMETPGLVPLMDADSPPLDTQESEDKAPRSP